MLAKLNEITERFDALDESYQNTLQLSEESRKVNTENILQFKSSNLH